MRRGGWIAFLLLASPPAWAAEAQWGFVGLGGILFDALGKTSASESGGTGFFGTVFVPSLLLSARSGQKWFVRPALSYTPLGRDDSDGGTNRTIFTAAVDAGRRFGEADARLGAGVLFYRLSARGGSATLNNGNTQTTFLLPAYDTASRVFIVEAGAGIDFKQGLRGDFDAWIAGIGGSRRTVSLQLSVSYGVL
jgi:hypothetical protein